MASTDQLTPKDCDAVELIANRMDNNAKSWLWLRWIVIVFAFCLFAFAAFTYYGLMNSLNANAQRLQQDNSPELALLQMNIMAQMRFEYFSFSNSTLAAGSACIFIIITLANWNRHKTNRLLAKLIRLQLKSFAADDKPAQQVAEPDRKHVAQEGQ